MTRDGPLPPPAMQLHPRLTEAVRRAHADAEHLTRERRAELDRVATWIRTCRELGRTARLLFVCTHNSRRSQMAQAWAAAAAAWFGIDGIETFSGGTEATAFDPRAVAALARSGFEIEHPGDGANPRFAVGFAPARPRTKMWSKIYDAVENPREAFAAIMTCDAADEACPVVAGADLRVALPFDDPKRADGTPDEAAIYDERAAQIATQMLYLVSRSVS